MIVFAVIILIIFSMYVSSQIIGLDSGIIGFVFCSLIIASVLFPLIVAPLLALLEFIKSVFS